ncbi:hypothetical protein DFP73DRAFT_583916 [Morchella snyderi]|nr:hypothetical protein DFP73DRAFT_583916 [Morchella snyderi]
MPPSHRPPSAAPPLLQTPADLHHARTLSQARLKQSWERIFTRFSHDFSGIADEIDGATGALLVDNGHLRSLADADIGLDDDADDDPAFSTDDDDAAAAMPQRCARCAERDELDDSPCRHRAPEKTETVQRQGPTAAQILAWTPAQLHTHLAALSARIDTCDLSFQLQKHGIGGRAVAALALPELGTRLRLREPPVVAVVWAEVRRLQAILAGEEKEVAEEGEGEGEDAWAPPPRSLDPFYSAAWRDEHPDGTPAAFRGGKRRREEAAAAAAGVGGGGKKRLKVVRVGAPKDVAVGPMRNMMVVGPMRNMMVGVAIPVRTRETTPAASRKAKATTPAVRKHAVQTPGPASSATTSTSAGTSSTTPAALKSILKKPRTPATAPAPAIAIATAAPPKATTTTTPTPKAPPTATTRTASKSTRTPRSAPRAQTGATPTSRTPRPKTPPPTSAAAEKTASQTPLPKTATTTTTTTALKPAPKTPKTPATTTKTQRQRQRQRQRPKDTPAKKTPKTAGNDTPGWTASVDRARLRGHSFLGFADGVGGGGGDGDGDGGEDELASPGAGQRGGGRSVGGGRGGGVVKEKGKGKGKGKAVDGGGGGGGDGGDGVAEVSALETALGVGGGGGEGGEGGSLHACSGRGFCFVCMDLEGEEDDLI